MSLCPKSVLITGANRGLGLEFVKQFVDLPVPPQFVFATCRSPETAKELQELAKGNPTIIPMEMDVTAIESIVKCEDVVGKLVREAGLNLLINNAGMCVRDTDMNHVTPEDMMSMYQVNAVGPLLVTRAFIPLLKMAHTYCSATETVILSINISAIVAITSLKGSIENTKSVHNLYGYRSSKAALNMINKLLSIELKGQGVFLVGLQPGWVRTDMGGKDADLGIEESVQSIMTLFEQFVGDGFYGKYVDRFGKELAW